MTSTGTPASRVALWPSLSFRDVDAMIAWLEAIGFEQHEVHRDDHDASVVVHAQMLWPPGGGIMFGSLREGGVIQNAGSSAVYLVTSDPDAAFDAAIAAGGSVVRAMVSQDYGGRGGSVLDPEGNHWSFGDYQPE